MEQISKHANNALTPHLTGHGKRPEAAQIGKKRQLWDLIKQSFAVFNLYGKSPEDLESIGLAFWMTLEDCTEGEITAAFKSWMRASSVMPTPRDIRAQIEDDRRLSVQYSESGGRAVPSQYMYRFYEKMEWALLTYGQAQAKNLIGRVQAHVAGMQPEARKEYIKYLTTQCGYPKGVFQNV